MRSISGHWLVCGYFSLADAKKGESAGQKGWRGYSGGIQAGHCCLRLGKREHQSLGVGAISSNEVRSRELECIMTAALATRGLMLAGLEAAFMALGCAEEPAIRYFQWRPDGGEHDLRSGINGV
jgi:hypothetical protein